MHAAYMHYHHQFNDLVRDASEEIDISRNENPYGRTLVTKPFSRVSLLTCSASALDIYVLQPTGRRLLEYDRGKKLNLAKPIFKESGSRYVRPAVPDSEPIMASNTKVLGMRKIPRPADATRFRRP
jgi:hypothetical protein